MRRLLALSSVLLALVFGGIAVAAYDNEPFAGQPTIQRSAVGRSAAVRPTGDGQLSAEGRMSMNRHPTEDGQSTPEGQPIDALPIVDLTKTPAEPTCIREEVLAKFRAGADPAIVAARHTATIASAIPQLGIYVLAVPPGTQAERIAALSADPDVEYAEPNAVVGIPERPSSGSAPCSEGNPPAP